MKPDRAQVVIEVREVRGKAQLATAQSRAQGSHHFPQAEGFGVWENDMRKGEKIKE